MWEREYYNDTLVKDLTVINILIKPQLVQYKQPKDPKVAVFVKATANFVKMYNIQSIFTGKV